MILEGTRDRNQVAPFSDAHDDGLDTPVPDPRGRSSTTLLAAEARLPPGVARTRFGGGDGLSRAAALPAEVAALQPGAPPGASGVHTVRCIIGVHLHSRR